MAEAGMRLVAQAAEAGALVDVAGGDEDALRPQRDLAIARLAGEADAFIDQPCADAEAARLGLDQQQAQLGLRPRLLDQEHRAEDLARLLGEPAALELGVVGGDEFGDDLGDHRLEALAPPEFLPIAPALPADHPAHIPPPLPPQDIAGAGGGTRL